MNNYLYIFIWVFIWFLFWYLIWKVLKYDKIREERKKSVKKSRSVILGETFETIAPFMKNIPYHPKDMVFIGKWIDYLVLDGLSNGNLKKIVFLEIKTWKSQLNKNEKQIKNFLNYDKVKYEVIRFF